MSCTSSSRPTPTDGRGPKRDCRGARTRITTTAPTPITEVPISTATSLSSGTAVEEAVTPPAISPIVVPRLPQNPKPRPSRPMRSRSFRISVNRPSGQPRPSRRRASSWIFTATAIWYSGPGGLPKQCPPMASPCRRWGENSPTSTTIRPNRLMIFIQRMARPMTLSTEIWE